VVPTRISYTSLPVARIHFSGRRRFGGWLLRALAIAVACLSPASAFECGELRGRTLAVDWVGRLTQRLKSRRWELDH
jgi:hypothetical protein